MRRVRLRSDELDRQGPTRTSVRQGRSPTEQREGNYGTLPVRLWMHTRPNGSCLPGAEVRAHLRPRSSHLGRSFGVDPARDGGPEDTKSASRVTRGSVTLVRRAMMSAPVL